MMNTFMVVARFILIDKLLNKQSSGGAPLALICFVAQSASCFDMAAVTYLRLKWMFKQASPRCLPIMSVVKIRLISRI